MQFSGNADEQDIVNMSRKLAGGSNSTSFKLKDIVTYSNQALREIYSWMWSVYGGWFLDDTNQPDLPDPTSALNSGQQVYVLPVETEYILGMEWQDQNGNWTSLTPITLERIKEQGAETDFKSTSGNPQYYRLIGNTVKIYPASNFTRSNALKANISRDIVEFTSSSTTAEPGFSNLFHEAIPTFCALQQAKIKQLKNKTDLQKDWDGNEAQTNIEGGFKKRIKSFYRERFRQMFPPRLRTSDNDIIREFIS